MKIQLEIDGGVAWIWFVDPKGHNPMGFQFFDELEQALHTVSENSQVRAAIFATKEKNLSVGLDLKEFANAQPQDLGKVMEVATRVFGKVTGLSVPTLCLFKGLTVGGALEMGIGCDFRIAAEDARISVPGVKIGIFNPAGTCFNLPRLIGIARSKELLMSVKMIDASTAKEWGLVQDVVAAEDIFESAKDWAQNILSMDPQALKSTKFLIENSYNNTLSSFLELEKKETNVCVVREEPLRLMKNFWKK